MRNQRHVYSRLLLCGLMAAGLGSAVADDQQASTSATSGNSSNSSDAQLEAVVVSGLRESLGKSLEEKRKAEIVQDSINALELGRFPDDDVADSLRHITGVNIISHHRR